MLGLLRSGVASGLVLVVLVAVVVTSTGAETSWTGRYLAYNSPVMFTCEPREPPVPDPNDTIWDYCSNCLYAWLLRAEPQCYPVDAANMLAEETGGEASDWGYGGYLFLIKQEHLGRSMVITAVDDFTPGPAPLTLFVAGDFSPTAPLGLLTIETCGHIVATLDDEWPHGPSPPQDPAWEVWVRARSVAVTDTLDVCMASTGTISGGLVA